MLVIPVSVHPAYEVRVGAGLLSECGEQIRKACGGGSSCAVVTDSHVAPLYGAKVRAGLEAAGVRVVELVVPAGEATKCFEQVAGVCEAMAAGRLDRGSFLVALGGGVVGDLAGFAASVFLRGIPYAQLPTTLLAQVDSSVGGKTGINLRCGKNLVGVFHQPRLVLADTETHSSLPARICNEGLAECIKHGVIRDRELAVRAVDLMRDNPAAFVARNVAIKAAIVADDEFETKGIRALLNFGHTLGHAIEQSAGYGTLLHGEAIAIGMAAALDLSVRKAGLPKDEAAAVLAQIQQAGLPTRLPAGLDTHAILEAMSRDKKFRDGRIRFILADRLGSARMDEDLTAEDLGAALERLGRP
jgi:3-dehydroquinate synthase